MRTLVVLMTLFAGVCPAPAQDQERKLIERLLRPNTALVNSAQEKTFVATSTRSFDKRVPVAAFYTRQKPLEKTVPTERALTSPQVAPRHFRMGESAANLAPRTKVTANDKIIPTRQAAGIRAAPESTTMVTVREFAGTRPFLGQGKSQKALRAYDRPLTLEEVRELLNKSK